MKDTGEGTKPGDWVRIPDLWPGIWQVYRVLAGFNEDEWSPGVPPRKSKRVLVFSHRLVNDSWKRSFAHQCCELPLIRPLGAADQKRTEALLSSDKEMSKAFAQYQAKQNRIDLVVNIKFGGLNKKAAAGFSTLCAQMLAERIKQGVTIPEVLEILQENGLEEKRHELPQQMTLRLICVNHELRKGDFVHRDYRVLNS
jgi:hypothetical protein